jgi:hypothetical protein
MIIVVMKIINGCSEYFELERVAKVKVKNNCVYGDGKLILKLVKSPYETHMGALALWELQRGVKDWFHEFEIRSSFGE